MAEKTARLEAKVSPLARRLLRMLAVAEDTSMSEALDAHLIATLPSADELADRLRGPEAIPA